MAGPEDLCPGVPVECVEAMEQPQASVPDYHRPDGVTEERRNAPTPPPGDDRPDEVVALDLVSDNLMPEQELGEAASHGHSTWGRPLTNDSSIPFDESVRTDVLDPRLATICSIVQPNQNSIRGLICLSSATV